MRTRSKLGLLLVALAATGPTAVDAYVWAVEVAAVIVAVLAVDALDGRRIGALQVGPHRRTVHMLLWVYVGVMLVGATWTYGAAPPGAWLQAAFDLTRNPWDRIGHLFQGALPALVVLGVRRAPGAGAQRGAAEGGARRERLPLLPALGLALAAGLAVAGLFEALEAAFAHFAPASVDFVDAQGDANDRGWDLFWAGLGAGLAACGERTCRAT